MDSIQRTVPRSAQKAQKQRQYSVSPSQTRYRPRASNSTAPPLFDASLTPRGQGRLTEEPNGVPELRDDFATLYKNSMPQNDREYRMLQPADARDRVGVIPSFCAATQMAVRWVGHPGRDAIAVAGSSDGIVDQLSVFAVRTDTSGSLTKELRRTILHNGRVAALASSGSDGLLVSASVHGTVSVLTDVEHSELEIISSPKNDTFSRDGAVDLCLLDSQVCVAGERGSLYLIPLDEQGRSSQISNPEQTSDSTLRAISAVDVATPLVAAAGANGVTIWDFRDRQETTRLISRANQCISAVTTDISQPHFVLGGSINGVVYTWDRRMSSGSRCPPLTYAHIHQGPVWDISIANAGRPGRVLTCGEDGSICLADFGAANLRNTENGWNYSGNFWSNDVDDIDISRVYGDKYNGLGINSVDAHFSAELFAFASDSAIVGFGKLYDF